MRSLDLRTRTEDDVHPVDVSTFLDVTVPTMLARNGRVAADAMRATGLESITIAVDGIDATWRLDHHGDITVVRDDSGRARADLSTELFSSIVADTTSAVAVLASGEDVMRRGRITHLVDWEIVLRALLDGRPAHRDGLVTFVDRDGAPLDLERRFTPADDPDELAHFLTETGFAHLTGVVAPADLAAIDLALTERRDRAERDDPTSWWARTDAADEEVCVRFNDLRDEDLPVSLGGATSIIVDALDCGHEFDHIDALLKPVGVVEGISDLPWHKDCALGLHSHQCARVVTGVSITASGPDNGQLGVVAGSHRVNLGQFTLPDALDLPVVWIATEPGDVTVHLSCTLHSSTPPLHSERRVAYVTWRLPGDSRTLDDDVRAVRDRAGRETFSSR